MAVVMYDVVMAISLPEAALVVARAAATRAAARRSGQVWPDTRRGCPFLDETHGHLHSERGGHDSTLATPARMSTRRAAARGIVFDCARFGRAIMVAVCARSIASSALVTC